MIGSGILTEGVSPLSLHHHHLHRVPLHHPHPHHHHPYHHQQYGRLPTAVAALAAVSPNGTVMPSFDLAATAAATHNFDMLQHHLRTMGAGDHHHHHHHHRHHQMHVQQHPSMPSTNFVEPFLKSNGATNLLSAHSGTEFLRPLPKPAPLVPTRINGSGLTIDGRSQNNLIGGNTTTTTVTTTITTSATTTTINNNNNNNNNNNTINNNCIVVKPSPLSSSHHSRLQQSLSSPSSTSSLSPSSPSSVYTVSPAAELQESQGPVNLVQPNKEPNIQEAIQQHHHNARFHYTYGNFHPPRIYASPASPQSSYISSYVTPPIMQTGPFSTLYTPSPYTPVLHRDPNNITADNNNSCLPNTSKSCDIVPNHNFNNKSASCQSSSSSSSSVDSSNDSGSLSPPIIFSESSCSTELSVRSDKRSFKIPSGKEGSLKHRILTRPEMRISKKTSSYVNNDCNNSNNNGTNKDTIYNNNNALDSTSGSSFLPPLPPPPITVVTLAPVTVENKERNSTIVHSKISNGTNAVTEIAKSRNGVNAHNNHQRRNIISSNGSCNDDIPRNFCKGSLIQLTNGRLTKIEDMVTEDFLISAEESPIMQLDPSTVVRIREQKSGSVLLTLCYGARKYQIDYETRLEHPYFVIGRGWSSCSPEKTFERYQLTCQKLRVGDVCIALSPRVTPTRNSASTKVITTSTTDSSLLIQNGGHSVTTTITTTTTTTTTTTGGTTTSKLSPAKSYDLKNVEDKFNNNTIIDQRGGIFTDNKFRNRNNNNNNNNNNNSSSNNNSNNNNNNNSSSSSSSKKDVFDSAIGESEDTIGLSQIGTLLTTNDISRRDVITTVDLGSKRSASSCSAVNSSRKKRRWSAPDQFTNDKQQQSADNVIVVTSSFSTPPPTTSLTLQLPSTPFHHHHHHHHQNHHYHSPMFSSSSSSPPPPSAMVVISSPSLSPSSTLSSLSCSSSSSSSSSSISSKTAVQN